MNQAELEYKYSKESTVPYIINLFKENDMELKAIGQLESYLTQDFDYTYVIKGGETRERGDLMEAHEALRDVDLTKLITKVIAFIVSMNTKPISIQALVGMMLPSFNEMSQMSRKLVAIGVVLEFIEKHTEFIETMHNGEYLYWYATIELEDTTPLALRSYVLPSIEPIKKLTDNNSIGYKTIHESVILGGHLKHHDEDVCLDNINRKNSVAFRFEHRLGTICAPKFNPEPKLKKDGNMETRNDVAARFESWKQLHEELPERCAVMYANGNRFYIPHKVDIRLRTYAKAHHFNYMGTKWLKAMVQFSNKEITRGEW